ncbi:MAG: tyrosine-type recombinase/integrase [Candidatus Pacebacteria bacterium]|nr:tyrosine-type recombinase/integrase [Candidatus Paceibacterota bacterium]
MPIYRRKLGNGKLSDNYYYDFRVGGKRFRGSTGETKKRKAEDYERDYIARLKQQKSKQSLALNFGKYIAGGTDISIEDAWEKFLKKPSPRKMSKAREKATKSRWRDFCSFMEDQHPKASSMAQVTRQMAEEYIHHIRTEGRWNSAVSFERTQEGRKKRQINYKPKTPRLSTAAQNDFLQTCRMVFARLQEDAGLLENPFAHINKVPNEPTSRQIFTLEELKSIHDKADDFLYPLFLTAITTGLREGDICLLKWDHLDAKREWIHLKMQKTGKPVDIPILPELRRYLLTLPQDGEYVFPELAATYKRNRTLISERVKKFLNETLKLKTRERPDKKHRQRSVKDIHSCRHTFVYLAGLHGIPLPIVQSIVGHMSTAVTKLYMAHATNEAKLKEVARLKDAFGFDDKKGTNKKGPTLPVSTLLPRNQQLVQLVKSITRENCLKKKDELLALLTDASQDK